MNDTKSSPNDEPRTDGATATQGTNDDGAQILQDLEGLRARAEERDQFFSLLQRTQADFENYRKRIQREREQEAKYLHGNFAADILPVLDNLERAIQAARQVGETGPLVQGVGMVQNQLLDLLRRHGVTPIEALGRPFDPNLHQAVMQQPSADKPPHTVLQVLEQGFKIHDRVLRPARVVVSAAPEG
jgi:molecular chaperone GrpE